MDMVCGGVTLASVNMAPSVKSSPNRADDEGDLVYCRERYLKTATGSWLSRDPAEEDEGGPNLYCFVGDNPINSFDPHRDRVQKWWDNWRCNLELELVIGVFSSARDAMHINLSSVAGAFKGPLRGIGEHGIRTVGPLHFMRRFSQWAACP